MNLQDHINRSPMTPFQVRAVAVCIMINMLDGFDVLAVAFTAPEIARQWDVAPAALGILLSAGLFGMAAGSLLLAPLADRLGRRVLIVSSLGIISAGMLLSALSRDVGQLAALRVFTGLGIGALLASLNTIVAEYASDRRRDLAVATLQAGYPVGATLGGLLSILIVAQFGWRAVFFLSGALSALMIPVVLRALPESLAWLTARQPRNALASANAIVKRLGLPALDALPTASRPTGGSRSASRELLALESLLLWAAFFLLMVSFYFVMSWTPKLLVDSGLSADTGRSAGVLLNLAGILGCCVMGYVAGRVGIGRMAVTYLGGGALCMTLFGLVDQQSLWMPVLGLAVGYFMFGAMSSLYAIAPRLYTAQTRTTGTGLAIGLGRFGAIIGPSLAGFLLDGGMRPERCFMVFALPAFVAMLAVLVIRRRVDSVGRAA